MNNKVGHLPVSLLKSKYLILPLAEPVIESFAHILSLLQCSYSSTRGHHENNETNFDLLITMSADTDNILEGF